MDAIYYCNNGMLTTCLSYSILGYPYIIITSIYFTFIIYKNLEKKNSDPYDNKK